MNLKQYVDELTALQNMQTEVLSCLRAKFNELPQDVGVKRFGNNGFVIKFSQLQDNWTPVYYDYKYTYELLLKIFEHTRPENLINKWERIKQTGFTWDDVVQCEQKFKVVCQKLNPEMIKLVDAVIYG